MKPRSSIQRKADYQKAQKYTPAQRMSYVPCECDPRSTMPPQAVLDKIADQQMTGGFRLSTRKIAGRAQQSNVCRSCFTAKSVSGSCNCP